MEALYRFFPLSDYVAIDNLKTLIISVAIYVVACGILGIIQAAFKWISLVGPVIKVVFSIVGLYCCAGIILSFLRYFA